ncbi:expressed unknown protein [Ectocarpus siliculosus]|uniref:Uncharacterized protein n=1 Tax=Ectocarpus siliculosus TaxID=2880 RepID=D8LGT7_ECTSI|nr:expressed unknown protein [Ectocarpus siliculosus]|eukprot:CBN75790.1 expressed unknown protein [Ectocarpus siliculosus]
MAPRRWALCGLGYTAALALLAFQAPAARAQDSDTCVEVVASNLEDDDFPSADTLYTNSLGDDVRGEYISEDGGYFIWYSPTVPTEWTSETPAAGIEDCNGVWVLSSYPLGDSFTDTVWYEASDSPQCQTNPAELTSTWVRVESDGDVTTETTVEVVCDTPEVVDGDSDGGLSNKTVVVLLIVVGAGFMLLMCLGALACCIHKGPQAPEENILPPGELPEEGSVIGGKAGASTEPGLHAHPEVQGAQHPRPENWAPSYTSNRNGAIPTGSRSGPSVRSIGYA